MKFPVKEYEQCIVLALNGEVDLSRSPQAREQILTELKKVKNYWWIYPRLNILIAQVWPVWWKASR